MADSCKQNCKQCTCSMCKSILELCIPGNKPVSNGIVLSHATLGHSSGRGRETGLTLSRSKALSGLGLTDKICNFC